MSQHQSQVHRQQSEEAKWIDRLADIAAVVYPLTGLPQLILILQTHQAAGVSLISWVAFGIFEVVFLAYGILHRLRPVIVTQALWLLINIGIIAAVIAYRS